MKRIFEFFTKRHLLANALTVMILLGGAYSLFKINREEFPNADTGRVMIRTSYPGASPEDMELNVTNKLEDALKSVVGIKTMSSTSMENSSSLWIAIDEDEDQDEVYDEIVDAVNGVNSLPDDATTPRIRLFNPKMKSIMRIGVSSSALTYRELRNYAHDFEKKLLEVPGVAEVGLSGYRDREVRIEVSPDDMMRYEVSMHEIIQAISARNIRAVGGLVETATEQKNVITLAKFQDPLDVGEVAVRSYPGGAVVRVKDVATIYDDFKDERLIRRINGKPAISVRITKNASADIVQTADAIKALISREQRLLPPDTIEFVLTRDDALRIHDKFQIVKLNGLLGLTLVFLVLAAFLSFHTSFWVAMGIPVSLMGVMIVLPFFDVELDSLTMAAMVLVIGIIVDDAIVIAENIFQHREKGETPLEAAVNGLHEVAMPVFTTITTTILAFLPMFFIKGMLGKFIYVIPLTVIVALSASLVESYFILPAHLLPGLHGGKEQKLGRSWFRPVRKGFERMLTYLLPLRYVWLFTACLFFVGTIMYAANSVRFTLFARGKNVDSLTLTLEMPLGTPIQGTSEKMRELEGIIATFSKNEITAYAAEIGSGGFRGAQGQHIATLTLYLPPASQLTRPVKAITRAINKKTAKIKGIQSLTFGRSRRGFHTGKAIEIMVKGADDNTRDMVVGEVLTFLRELSGVSDLERDDKAGKDEIAVQPNDALLGRYDLTVADIAQTIRTMYGGQVATTTRYGDEDVDFRVILQRNDRQRLDYLKQIKITNRQGQLINLEEVANFTTRPGVYAVYHENGEPTITITGEVNETIITPLEVMAAVEQYFDFEKMRNYPGIRLDIGGEAADSRQALFDILMSFGLASIGIYFLLMLLFESLTQPLIVLVTIPFGVVGVILTLVLHGITQASFFTGIGVIGLAGVVVNDALVMVDHLNDLRRRSQGRNVTALIAAGAADRLRPVILTTVTTVGGLLPLIYGIGGEDAMMAPMAMALGYGLFFATPITLLLLPCLYLIGDDIRMAFQRVFHRKSTPDLTLQPQAVKELSEM